MNTRNQNIELVRIAAAFGIVLFHSGASFSSWGYSGLVAFTAISTYFANSSAGKLTRRILLPWVFWTIFYMAWRFAADGDLFHDDLSPIQSILYGTHLWFLPFIFIANLTVSRLRSDHLPLISALIGFCFLAATPWWRELQLSFDPPVAQFLHALPAVLIGVAFRTKTGMVISALGLVVCAAWQVPGVSLPYALGGGALLGAIVLPHLRWNVESLSTRMFGVYLVHIAALGVFNRITGPETLTTATAAFLASIIGVWIVSRYLPISRTVHG